MAKTVGDLIAELSALNPELIVGLSVDEEGNGFKEWSGDFSYANHNAERDYDELFQEISDEAEEEEEEAGWGETFTSEDTNAIILWP